MLRPILRPILRTTLRPLLRLISRPARGDDVRTMRLLPFASHSPRTRYPARYGRVSIGSPKAMQRCHARRTVWTLASRCAPRPRDAPGQHRTAGLRACKPARSVASRLWRTAFPRDVLSGPLRTLCWLAYRCGGSAGFGRAHARNRARPHLLPVSPVARSGRTAGTVDVGRDHSTAIRAPRKRRALPWEISASVSSSSPVLPSVAIGSRSPIANGKSLPMQICVLPYIATS